MDLNLGWGQITYIIYRVEVLNAGCDQYCHLVLILFYLMFKKRLLTQNKI